MSSCEDGVICSELHRFTCVWQQLYSLSRLCGSRHEQGSEELDSRHVRALGLSVTFCVQTLALWASSALCIHDVKWICYLLALVASISVCCLLCFLTSLMLSGEAVLFFASPLFVCFLKLNKLLMIKRKKKKEKKREKKREREYYELIAGFSFNFVSNERLLTFRTALVYQTWTLSHDVGVCHVLLGGFLSLVLVIDELLS